MGTNAGLIWIRLGLCVYQPIITIAPRSKENIAAETVSQNVRLRFDGKMIEVPLLSKG